MPQAEFITVPTFDVLKVYMSQPSNRSLTIEQKADLLQDEMLYSLVPNNPFALFVTSPTSGNQYLLTFDKKTLVFRCNCKAKGHCKRAECANREWREAMIDLMGTARTSVYSAHAQTLPAYMTRPAPTAAQRSADWD